MIVHRRKTHILDFRRTPDKLNIFISHYNIAVKILNDPFCDRRFVFEMAVDCRFGNTERVSNMLQG